MERIAPAQGLQLPRNGNGEFEAHLFTFRQPGGNPTGKRSNPEATWIGEADLSVVEQFDPLNARAEIIWWPEVLKRPAGTRFPHGSKCGNVQSLRHGTRSVEPVTGAALGMRSGHLIPMEIIS